VDGDARGVIGGDTRSGAGDIGGDAEGDDIVVVEIGDAGADDPRGFFTVPLVSVAIGARFRDIDALSDDVIDSVSDAVSDTVSDAISDAYSEEYSDSASEAAGDSSVGETTGETTVETVETVET
jgi:hypothetical protein